MRCILKNYSHNARWIVDEVGSTESAIISSFSTSVSGIIVLLNTKHWIKISQML